jgi:hypothetical protein
VPIGLVSDELLQEELHRLSGSKNPDKTRPHVNPVDIVEIERPGRKEGDVNVPDSLRKIIGEEAVINGRQAALQLASEFGISPSSVSAYANGATSTTTYDTPSKSIIGHINKSRERAIKRAQKTLNGALTAITQEKLDYADPKDLASIAKDMTVVIKNLEPPQQTVDPEGVKAPQFVIFAPQFRDERTFETITVQE